MIAARKGQIKIVRLLVEEVTKINLQNEAGETALHNGAVKGHIDVVRYLNKNKNVKINKWAVLEY